MAYLAAYSGFPHILVKGSGRDQDIGPGFHGTYNERYGEGCRKCLFAPFLNIQQSFKKPFQAFQDRPRLRFPEAHPHGR